MPVYNGAQYLDEAILSVLDQSDPDFEFIIVDDHSSDASVQKILSYRDSRIRFFQNRVRLGQVPNYNQSIRYARGSFIKLMHQDDLLEPRCLERQVDVLRRCPDAAFVCSDSWVMDCDASPFLERTQLFKMGGIIPKGKVLKSFLRAGGRNFIGEPPVVTFRKDIASKTGFFNTRILLYNDIEFWLRMNAKFPCYYLDEILSCFRVHPNQVTQTYMVKPEVVCPDLWRLFRSVERHEGRDHIANRLLLLAWFYPMSRFLMGRAVKMSLGIPQGHFRPKAYRMQNPIPRIQWAV